jgi:hypothetical protein
LQEAGIDLGLTGFSANEWEALIAGEPASKAGQTKDEAAPQTPGTSISRLGDVWGLGDHQLLCVDAILAESHPSLLSDAPVDMTGTTRLTTSITPMFPKLTQPFARSGRS